MKISARLYLLVGLLFATGLTLLAQVKPGAKAEPCPPGTILVGEACVLPGTVEEKTPEKVTPETPKTKLEEAPAPTPVPEKPLPPERPSDFNLFVTQSIGYSLDVFGHELFTNVPSTFAPINRAPVPGDYILGPGDNLNVRTWGMVDMNLEVEIDRTGQIFLPRIGALRVAGLRFDQLSGFLRSSIAHYYQTFDLSVTMGTLRSVQVMVVGQAHRPGTYTVSSLSTMVNTLFASGGPSSRGSMRHIQLKRANKLVTELDLYDLLTRGDTSKDVNIQNGDVIFIPAVGPQVALDGAINKPAIYELKNATETFAELFDEAGGLTNVANPSKISVERIDNRKVREVTEASLADLVKQDARDGDVVTIRRLGAKYDNAVTVRGNIAVPGRYPWHEGMRIHDLIPSRDVLVSEAYWERLAKQGQVATAMTGLKGLVHLEDVNWDYAVVERLGKQDLSAQLIPFNLGRAIAGDASDDKELQPNDVVTIFSQTDLSVPEGHRTRWIRVDGEVNSAGLYRVEPGETIQSVVGKAGGLTPDAYIFGSEMTRESARMVQQKQLDNLVDRLQTQSVRQPSVTKDTVADYAAIAEERNRTLARIRLLRATGRIVLEVNPTDTSASALPNLKIQDGDHLYIPPRPEFVTVVGSVNQTGSVEYSEGERVGDYLRRAGGATADADKSHSFVIRANGRVISSNNGLFSNGIESAKALPGDTIVIVPKVRDRFFIDNLKDWSQVLGNFGLAAAAVNVLK